MTKRCFTYCGDDRCNCDAHPSASPFFAELDNPIMPKELPSRADDIATIAEWLGFSASCIKGGEAWSGTCQALHDAAKTALARLRAEL